MWPKLPTEKEQDQVFVVYSILQIYKIKNRFIKFIKVPKKLYTPITFAAAEYHRMNI